MVQGLGRGCKSAACRAIKTCPALQSPTAASEPVFFAVRFP